MSPLGNVTSSAPDRNGKGSNQKRTKQATLFISSLILSGPVIDIDRAAPASTFLELEDGTVTILLNDGGGRFHQAPGSPFSAGSQPNDFAVADFNHDGNRDLAIVNTQTPFISIFLGDGRGGFHPAPGSPIRTPGNGQTS